MISTFNKFKVAEGCSYFMFCPSLSVRNYDNLRKQCPTSLKIFKNAIYGHEFVNGKIRKS